MGVPFLDRHDAGRQLASRLHHLAGRPDVIVLGLARGGVPVAAEVARALMAPLDVLVVRKLGVPGHEEFAMGAIASGGVRALNDDVIRGLRISSDLLDAVTAKERRELERREQRYRRGRSFPDLRGRTVILVDDGVATGSSMLAAVHALRQHRPTAIIAATPVMSEAAQRLLSQAADRCETVAVPEPFQAVGLWYYGFDQTTDEEVRTLLQQAAERETVNQAQDQEWRHAVRS